MSCPPSESRGRNEPNGGGVGTFLYGLMRKSKSKSITERERARAPVLDYSEPNRAERSRPDVEESWLLFEGIDTFLSLWSKI